MNLGQFLAAAYANSCVALDLTLEHRDTGLVAVVTPANGRGKAAEFTVNNADTSLDAIRDLAEQKPASEVAAEGEGSEASSAAEDAGASESTAESTSSQTSGESAEEEPAGGDDGNGADTPPE